MKAKQTAYDNFYGVIKEVLTTYKIKYNDYTLSKETDYTVYENSIDSLSKTLDMYLIPNVVVQLNVDQISECLVLT